MTTAFFGDKKLKSRLLRRLDKHRRLDQLVKGVYWENGKGCALGCMVHASVNVHEKVAAMYGLTVNLAALIDIIFEGLRNDKAMFWPEAVIDAIPVGSELSNSHLIFFHWLLTDKSVNPGINHPIVRDAVAKCAEFIKQLIDTGSIAIAESAESAESARSAAAAAWSAWSAESAASARSAAASARSAAAAARSAAAWSASSARSAAASAESAWSAELAAESAWSVQSAAWSARSAAASRRAPWLAAAAAYQKMSEKLIDILKASRP